MCVSAATFRLGSLSVAVEVYGAIKLYTPTYIYTPPFQFLHVLKKFFRIYDNILPVVANAILL